MIVARGTRDGADCLILGLTRENVTRLLAGDPMRLTPTTHTGIPYGLEILILGGETQADIYRALKAVGAIGPNTRMIHRSQGDGA